MEEYIGFNEKTDEFLSMDELCFVEMGSYSSILLDVLQGHEKDVKLFKYIEKTDETPEKNKIYAGSSILKIIQYQYIGEDTETIDYIRYFPKIASYGLSKNPEYRLFQYADEIEVIGTLQQDKHLLGDADGN